MASKLFFRNFNLAERALTHCVRSLTAIEPIITTQSTTTPRFLVSLRSFASGGPPDNQTPSESSSKSSHKVEAKQPNQEDSDPTATPPSAPPKSTFEAEQVDQDGPSEDPSDTNPVLAALRASIQEQILQLKSQSTMMEQTMPDPLPWWQRALSDKFGAWVQNFYADFLRSRVDKEFELQEFLEGAKDAFWMVHQLIGQEDYKSLKTMVSAKLLNAVETTGEEYRSGGLVWRTEIDEDVPIDAQLRRMSFWTGEQISEYDKEQAALEPENVSKLPMPAGRWLVMWVSYKAAQKTLITREEDGQIVAKLTDLRPALWQFAAGPLPEMIGGAPPAKLEMPFWLLKFG
jgi:hypothetical protein